MENRGGGQDDLATHIVAQDCAFLFYFLYVPGMLFFFPLCYDFSARHFPPSRDCGLCHLSISCWFSPFRLGPRHDGGLPEGLGVGFPCHNACVLLQFAFPRLAPPATLAVRGRFLRVVCLNIVTAFPSITLRVFPGFIAMSF